MGGIHEAELREDYWIKHFRADFPETGYNNKRCYTRLDPDDFPEYDEDAVISLFFPTYLVGASEGANNSKRPFKKFEKLLKERNVTAYQVSKSTGIARSTFTEWKNGTYQPKVNKLQKIANFFDVPIDYFLE